MESPSITQLAEQQGVKPLDDPSVLQGGFPEDEDVDEFIREVKGDPATVQRLARELAEQIDSPDLLKRIDADSEEAVLRIETFKTLYKKTLELKKELGGHEKA